ncbi:MAG: hypothetical protein JSR52_15535 [Planctomycetes bacterium]|nr:hypothetical protein [Planctomycetota bacterium]
MQGSKLVGMLALGIASQIVHGGDPLWLRMSGDASPSVTNLSHVYVLSLFRENGPGMQHEAVGASSIGSAKGQDANAFSLTTSIERDPSKGVFDDGIQSAYFSVIGIYDDGGVSISLLDSAFIPGFSSWNSLFATDESTVQSWLESGNTPALQSWFAAEVVAAGYAPNMGVRASQVDFSIADVNGTSFVAFEEIPSPGAIAFVWLCGGVIARRRRF